jgi:EAL domain-containing protein (putative c-di-GMP-specific phosphodiesterase class I)
LELELTESAAMSEVMAVEQTVAELQKLGVRLSIDDFGTGYASLTQLKRLPTYKLKIDQSFVRDMDNGDADKAMVNAIVRMAQAMGLRITAEGGGDPGAAEISASPGL